MMNRYKQLLTYIRSAVTRNYSEKSINSILDYISTSKQVRFCFSLLVLTVFIIYIKGFVFCSFFILKPRRSIQVFMLVIIFNIGNTIFLSMVLYN